MARFSIPALGPEYKPLTRVLLREMMDRHAERSGERVTYSWLAEQSGVARSTLEAIGSQAKHANPTLEVLDAICCALSCSPGELLEYQTATEVHLQAPSGR